MKLSQQELMIIGIDIEEKLGLLEPALQDYIANGPFQAWRSIKVADLQAAIERRRKLLTRIYDERQEEADASPSSHGEARSNCDLEIRERAESNRAARDE